MALFLQQVAGYSALEGGLALLPITVMNLLIARRAGALATRIGPRVPMAVGPVLGAAGLALYLRLDERADWVTQILPATVLFGVGLGLTVAPLTATVLGAVEESRAGVASGVNNAVARVAGLLAIAVVGAVVAARFRAAGGPPDATPLVPGAEGAHRAAEVAASVSALHAGMAVSASLVLAGGVVAAVGLTGGRRAGRATG